MRARKSIEPRITGEAPSRDPAETVLTQLRIKEALRRALEREAEKNQVSLNKEMTWRLEKSFEDAAKLDLHQIAQNLAINWLRYGERHLVRELEEGILVALERRDYEEARMHAIQLRTVQANAARERAARMQGTFAATGSLNVDATVRRPGE